MCGLLGSVECKGVATLTPFVPRLQAKLLPKMAIFLTVESFTENQCKVFPCIKSQPYIEKLKLNSLTPL